MIKSILVLSLLAFTAVTNAEFQTLELQDGDYQVEQSQWNSRNRLWTCWARNSRGQVFRGNSSWSNSQARRSAMNRCWNRSGRCWISRCH